MDRRTAPPRHSQPRALLAWGRLVLAVVLALSFGLTWIAAGAQTQPVPPLNGVVSDDTGKLDAGQVNAAAKALQDLGVKPLVIFSQTGLGYSDSDPLGRAAAVQFGLARSPDLLDPNLLEVVVILNSRRASLIYGDALGPALNQTRNGQAIGDLLRLNHLQPRLAAGQYTQGVVDTFNQAAQEINLYRNPPPTATPQPSVINNFDTRGIGNALIWICGVVVLLALIAILGPVLWRANRRQQEAAARVRALREQIAQARASAADMLTNLELPADPTQQIQYRFLALALANQRPQQLADITSQYHATYAKLSDALARFDALNQRQAVTEQDLAAALAEYQYVQGVAKEADGFIQHMSDVGRGLQGQIQAAPGETDAAKKAIAAATDELARLAAAAPDLQLPVSERLLAPAQANYARAQQALQAQPPQTLTAYDSATTAHQQADAALANIRALAQAYSQLAQARAALANARKQGYKLANADPQFANALVAVQRVATGLPSLDANGLQAALQQAGAAIEKAAGAVGGSIALHDANVKALAELKAAGESLRQFIQQGAVAFDKVDEYAPSSWQDIKGNGTEAQKRADVAYSLWQQASHLNDVSADGPQDFDKAAALVQQANGLIAEGRTLVQAILDRLKNLQESQRVASSEVQAADKDIAAGLAFVKQYDPDITPKPAEMLQQASSQVAQAKAEIGQPKPDWIKVVQLARSANDLADKALAEARTEEQAMEALRQRVQTTGQQAQASLSRAQNYIQIHDADIRDRTPVNLLAQAQAAYNKAQGILSQAQQAGYEDVAKAQALTDASNLYLQVQQVADNAYGQANHQFEIIDNLRRQTAMQIQQAQSAIQSASNYIQENRDVLSSTPDDYLDQAGSLLPRWHDGADAQTLQTWNVAAQRASSKAQQAVEQASDEIQRYNDRLEAQRQAEAAARAAALLTLFTSGSGRRSSGGSSWGGWGSWGGGGGGGGGGWGGGGSSSGSWGGGGSSSGSWGGGGSSSGSWGGGGSSSGGW